jgi:hypothetical protein
MMRAPPAAVQCCGGEATVPENRESTGRKCRTPSRRIAPIERQADPSHQQFRTHIESRRFYIEPFEWSGEERFAETGRKIKEVYHAEACFVGKRHYDFYACTGTEPAADYAAVIGY